MALVLDTGPLFGAFNRNDSAHSVCRELIEQTEEPLVIPAPVLVELEYLGNTRLQPGAFLTVLDNIIDGAFQIENLLPVDCRRIRILCDRYGDSDIGFVDAAVLAVVERLNEPKLATLDRRHFSMLRPQHVDVLRLLPD